MKWSIPKILLKNVFVVAVPLTVSSFGLTDALQPVATIAVAVHVA